MILDRQQRLTEEYVPRADLVLFVMSADRPFSESEVRARSHGFVPLIMIKRVLFPATFTQVRFLEYIRQWRKKVVFVVNKVDMLGSPEDVEEVKK